MCGISGILALNHKKISEEEINNMNDKIFHRGPDSSGIFIEDNIALGNRRLAIIDLNKDSDLPLFYKDKYVLIYNGEIYNYIEIRDELISIGHSFSTNSDSEVLLKAYIQWGRACLEKFNGMWAFAIWDRKNKELFCSRDRFGIKPFYWSNYNGRIYFGSEIKQLRALEVGKKCNYQELSLFLFSGCSNSSTQTFFNDINSLPPGHNLTISSNGSIKINSWYEIRSRIQHFNKKNDPDEFKYLLENSVKIRMRSDVNICTSLSGGLDSSSIVSQVSKLISKSNISKKFSAIHAKSSDPTLDESNFAELASQNANCFLHIIEPSYQNFLDVIKKLIYIQDEPFASKSVFMQYFVMKKAKELECKVMIDGQGADEILLGYSRFFLMTLRAYYEKNKIRGLIDHSIFSYKNNSEINLKNILKYILGNVSGIGRSEYLKYRMRFFNLSIESTKQLYQEVSRAQNDPLESQIIELEKTSLPQILRTEDRNSMANSVEARVPFLDFNLVEYCLNLAVTEKVKNGWTKYPLRESNLLTKNLAWRKSKLSYEAPEDNWDNCYSQYMLTKIKKSPLINKISNIENLSDQWFKISSKERWRIFNLSIWQEINNIDF